ncbi:flagellar protein FlgN [bacterium]|nr:flagellar protein FlgN [bacterium]
MSFNQGEMPNLMQRLCVILEQMHSLYARALPILDLERKSLIEMNFERLYQEMREKDEILSTIRKLDKERLKIQDYYAMINEVPSAGVTLKYFADTLLEGGEGDRELGRRMLVIREKIQSLIEKTKLSVKQNERFIEKSVSNLRGLAQAITDSIETGREKSETSPSKNTTYGKNAKVTKQQGQSGRLVSGQV